MGDIAEMMLEGTLCECCGVYIEGEADGVPRYCSKQCRTDRKPAVAPKTMGKLTPKKVKCPVCARKVTEAGLPDHIKALHTYSEVKAAHGMSA